MKFVKYSWGNDKDGNERYVIVQPLDENNKEVKRIKEDVIIDDSFHKNCRWGKMIYGSSVKYTKSGNIYYFNDIKKITKLDTEEVMREHFVGLI